MIFLILAMNVPNLIFYFLSTVLPTNLVVIGTAVGLEMFGVGFGYVGVMMFMMQVVSVGKYQTAHYAMCTGFMALGVSLFKMVSGDIQVALGYQNFFLWVVLSAIPVLLISLRIVPIGHKIQDAPSDPIVPTAI